MHTSQSGELSDFDLLATGVLSVMDLQGSHAWGVFARQLLHLYPSRLQAIQQLNWKERAEKVSARKPFHCHCYQKPETFLISRFMNSTLKGTIQ